MCHTWFGYFLPLKLASVLALPKIFTLSVQTKTDNKIQFNPINVQESDKAIYEIYQSKIKNLEVEKEKVIDGMMKQIKENPNYRNLSDDCMKNIREHIDCGSTWGGFYFNDESIMKIIERMK